MIDPNATTADERARINTLQVLEEAIEILRLEREEPLAYAVYVRDMREDRVS